LVIKKIISSSKASFNFSDSLPKWTPFRLRDRPVADIKTQILMDHHLIFLLQEFSQDQFPSHNSTSMTLLAFDLRDHSTQEVKLNEKMFGGSEESVYFKYKDNQIIKLGGSSNLMRITIESFQRIFFKISESHPIL